MAESVVGERNPAAKRARITDAALALFQSQGYAETTIDQIAAAAGVARRTVFGHFPTKEAILFDELAARRNVTIARLHERPRSEPPLVSLHAVMRQMCEQGYDRPLLTQIRNVLAAEPKLAIEHVSLVGGVSFEQELVAALEQRGAEASGAELQALAAMVSMWFLTAVRIYFRDKRRSSLLRCFDEVVAACVRASAVDLSPAI